MDLTGRAALITGGARMGAAIGGVLAASGMDVAFTYRRSAGAAAAAAASVREHGRRALTVQADLSRPEDCDAAVAAAADGFGRLDVLVNLASVYDRVPFDEESSEHWDRQLDVDLRAAFLCSRVAAPHMRRAGGGRIVNFTDWVAASGRPRYLGYVSYYVAKAAVKALTEALALDLAADGILVNAVAPGPILPPPGTSPETYAAVERATPLGRWGGESEIATTVRFLCETDFVTGETVRVDGGRHLK